MNTPICDFVRDYAARRPVRMHMPGHKGNAGIGPEALDLTEIDGADELYRSRGIIRESEINAASLFGAARTVYSAEGSSLCIRAMLYLALLTAGEKGIPGRLLAGRNAHRTLMSAAALLDLEIDWLMPAEGESLLSCTVTAEDLEQKLKNRAYMAVYLTSPDYLGSRPDLQAAAEICRRYGVPLLVDNAHGAYLKFLEPDGHPVSLGAAACCDSAHKTLSCLTGAAYLHLGASAPDSWSERAEQAMAMFASTSPSWLILQSLDRMNRELAGTWPDRLKAAAARMEGIKKALRVEGWKLIGSEPMKLTLNAAAYGYTGFELREILSRKNVVCEYADRDYLVLMASAETTETDWRCLEQALSGLPGRAPLAGELPALPVPERVLSIREAMLLPQETLPVGKTMGRIFADAAVSCPPAVPVVVAGERITKEAASWMEYCGISECQAVRERDL
jgi:arginine/lysine/ornithine decarboxylase